MSDAAGEAKLEDIIAWRPCEKSQLPNQFVQAMHGRGNEPVRPAMGIAYQLRGLASDSGLGMDTLHPNNHLPRTFKKNPSPHI